ncbi:hypothetical protein OH77DRAFT_1420206 [Trametes cingulata]|nr:hypothetical protein OH77DRAFT_1420206 [Trametes cingulata]
MGDARPPGGYSALRFSPHCIARHRPPPASVTRSTKIVHVGRGAGVPPSIKDKQGPRPSPALVPASASPSSQEKFIPVCLASRTQPPPLSIKGPPPRSLLPIPNQPPTTSSTHRSRRLLHIIQWPLALASLPARMSPSSLHTLLSES